ncbi:methylglutaconyl-CoA hydratase [Pustulibacterium marinum]|uniref:Methylglutaconyl-CoA hydratase n=1 Tax=Pustulibacterium marinum TaxID=1224947 RepID=A0A1I7EVM0_9FLAO|nr:enoyl-CoA hydratase/isomerase family protein [Pustulibacterium marinum]SFU27990.1 methylglutaconyl-CoA hydratase [Pustulibacterium marinum]
MQTGSIKTTIQENIATVTFGHPASNSFPSALLQELTDTFHKLSLNKSISVIILESEGDRAFCAGASFDELVAIETIEDGKAFFSGFANVLNAMRTCTKLIIGKVQGKAVGGGVGLIAACDYVLATEKASIKLSEFTIGIGPFVIAPAVDRKIGKTALADITLNAHEWKTAQWAKETGLYTQVLPDTESLDQATQELAEKLNTYARKALRAMKHTLWKGTEDWEELLYDNAEISGRLALSEETKKALSKFKK